MSWSSSITTAVPMALIFPRSAPRLCKKAFLLLWGNRLFLHGTFRTPRQDVAAGRLSENGT